MSGLVKRTGDILVSFSEYNLVEKLSLRFLLILPDRAVLFPVYY